MSIGQAKPTETQSVIVTGAAGFVGRHMIRHLERAGYKVIALVRNKPPIHCPEAIVSWSLGDPLPDGVTAQMAIHLAHDFTGEEGAERTVSGTAKLARELASAGTSRQVFVSSYSAGNHASSLYGRTKAHLERYFAHIEGAIIVRPGLVLGDGGICGRMAVFASRFPVVPLPDGGHGCVPVIEIERLCDEILALLSSKSPYKENNVFHSHFPKLRDIVLSSATNCGKKPIILNIPLRLAMPIMKIFEFLGIRLPVSSDSLEGFASNQFATHKSSIET